MEFLPLILIFLIFWLMFIRPQAKRAKAVQAMQASLAVGDKVMLTSGIFGTVVEIADARAVLSLSPGTEIEVMRAAIAEVDRGEQVPVEAAESTEGEHLKDTEN